MPALEDFKVGQKVRVIAKLIDSSLELLDSDVKAGFPTGAESTVSKVGSDFGTEYIYLKREGQSDWAFFPEMLEIIKED